MHLPTVALTHRPAGCAALALVALLATAPVLAQIAPPTVPASAPAGAIPPNPAASAGGTSDAVARCEAKTSAVERAKCRRELAQQAPTPARH